jgi:hypothetical protein
MSAAPINPMTPEQIELARTRLAATAYQLLCSRAVISGEGKNMTASLDTGGFLDLMAEAAASALHTFDGAMQQRYAETSHVNRDVAQMGRHAAQALAHYMRDGHVKGCHDCKLKIAYAALVQQKTLEIVKNAVIVQLDGDEPAATTTH